jgi:hypothetical protein
VEGPGDDVAQAKVAARVVCHAAVFVEMSGAGRASG